MVINYSWKNRSFGDGEKSISHKWDSHKKLIQSHIKILRLAVKNMVQLKQKKNMSVEIRVYRTNLIEI